MVARGQASVRLAGPGVGGRGAVATEHLPGPPAGQAHQVRLAATLGEPRVGEWLGKRGRLTAENRALTRTLSALLSMTPQEVRPVMRCHPVHDLPKRLRIGATSVPAGGRRLWA
jgi:hypothetical protein